MGEVRETVAALPYLQSAAFVTGEPCTSMAARTPTTGNPCRAGSFH
jgi:hypothetical protein